MVGLLYHLYIQLSQKQRRLIQLRICRTSSSNNKFYVTQVVSYQSLLQVWFFSSFFHTH